jgi:hypothetical protein
MSLRNLGRTAALFVIVACTSVAFAVNPADCQASASDESQVVEALRTMYAAAATDDLVRFHSVVSEKFYAFDGGQRFDGDALMNLIKTLHAAGGFIAKFAARGAEAQLSCEGEGTARQR